MGWNLLILVVSLGSFIVGLYYWVVGLRPATGRISRLARGLWLGGRYALAVPLVSGYTVAAGGVPVTLLGGIVLGLDGLGAFATLGVTGVVALGQVCLWGGTTLLVVGVATLIASTLWAQRIAKSGMSQSTVDAES